MATDQRIKILYLTACSGHLDRGRADHEIREVTQKIGAAAFRERLELVSCPAVRPEDLQRILLHYTPEVLHFSGGAEDDRVLFEDGRGGVRSVGAAALARLLEILGKSTRVVVLNAHGSRAQAEAVSRHIDCAIGMDRLVGADAPVAFAASFYQAIAFGASVGQAFELAKNALDLIGVTGDGAPVLHHPPEIDPRRLVLLPPERPIAPSPGVTSRRSRPAAEGARVRAGAVRRGGHRVTLVHPEHALLPRLRDLVQRLSGLDAAAARALVEAAPCAVLEDAPRAEALAAWRQLVALGAVAGVEAPPGEPHAPRLMRSPGGVVMAVVPQDEHTHGPFLLMAHPVPQALYRRVMGANPSRFRGDDRPVEGVTWDDAALFCARLSEMEGCTGNPYRLPTEAEWEHAARAGTDTAFSGAVDWPEVAWSRTAETQSVGTKQPNAWGLFDMSGNVWEWTHPARTSAGVDRGETGDLEIVKGGCYASAPSDVRIASREARSRLDGKDVGLRAARPLAGAGGRSR